MICSECGNCISKTDIVCEKCKKNISTDINNNESSVAPLDNVFFFAKWIKGGRFFSGMSICTYKKWIVFKDRTVIRESHYTAGRNYFDDSGEEEAETIKDSYELNPYAFESLKLWMAETLPQSKNDTVYDADTWTLKSYTPEGEVEYSAHCLLENDYELTNWLDSKRYHL